MKKKLIFFLFFFLLSTKDNLFTSGEYSWRRIKSPEEKGYKLEVPPEYKGVIKMLFHDYKKIRLKGIEEIVAIVTQKEGNKGKREILALHLVNKLWDRQEIVQEKAALALRKVLPSYDINSQISVGFEIVEGLGNPEEYVRRSAKWALKKIMPSLEQEARKAIAIRIIERWLYSPISYASGSAISSLTKILDYLDYNAQKAVVEKMQESLTSENEHKRKVTVRAFIAIIPSLKNKVIEDLAIDLKDTLEEGKTLPPHSIKAIVFVAEALLPSLYLNHSSLKEELEIVIRNLQLQP